MSVSYGICGSRWGSSDTENASSVGSQIPRGSRAIRRPLVDGGGEAFADAGDVEELAAAVLEDVLDALGEPSRKESSAAISEKRRAISRFGSESDDGDFAAGSPDEPFHVASVGGEDRRSVAKGCRHHDGVNDIRSFGHA